MLDMGFIEDIEKIMEKCAPDRRVVLFSATMPAGIVQVAKRRLGAYEVVEDFSEAVATELAEQVWLEVREADKLEALCRVIDVEEEFYGIVFTSTRNEADRIAKALEERGLRRRALARRDHPGRPRACARALPRQARGASSSPPTWPRARNRYRTPDACRELVLAPRSRTPTSTEWGRTGRAGNAGTALTLVTPDEYRKLFRFKKASGGGLKKAKVPAVDEVLSPRAAIASAPRIMARAAECPARDPEEGEAKQPAVERLWGGMADALLEQLDAKEALEAVLQEAYGSELDPTRYREIMEITENSVDAARHGQALHRRGASATMRRRAAWLPW